MTPETTDGPEELARRVWNTMERDYGVMIAAYFGKTDLAKMTDEEALAWAEVGKAAKWPETCGECGQEIS